MIKNPRTQEQIKFPVEGIEYPMESKRRFGLCDPDWVYVPAAATDVTKTWRRFGWTPLAERPSEYEGHTPIEETKEKQDENK